MVAPRARLMAGLLVLFPVLSGCDSCQPVSRKNRTYPVPLEQSARPHIGKTSQRWSGPCWRDFATPDRVGASTSISYDGQGFMSALTHFARTRGGFAKVERRFERQRGGALVVEQRGTQRSKQGQRTIRYEFSKRAGDDYVPVESTDPVLAEPRKNAQLCLCPADDRSVCYVGERVFCRGHSGALFTRPGPRLTSCVACGDRIEIEERKADGGLVARSWTRIENGAKLEFRSRKTPVEAFFRLDVPAKVVVESGRWLASGKAKPDRNHTVPYASLKAFCQSDARRCQFDAHGNLLEFTALGKDGTVRQRDVFSYACREQSAPTRAE